MRFNCDLGEGDSPGELARDLQLLPYLHLINLACGRHAGSPAQWVPLIHAAQQLGIGIGAHPSIGDRTDLGRIWSDDAPEDLQLSLQTQLQTIATVVQAQGARLHHVKAHGALYNQAAIDPQVAQLVATAVQQFDPQLILVGRSDSCLTRAGKALGMQVWAEAFADRAYLDDGQLVPRQLPGAVLTDPDAVAHQVQQLQQSHSVTTNSGQTLKIRARTICFHSDTPNILASMQAIQR